jgi:hypothetical protein
MFNIEPRTFAVAANRNVLVVNPSTENATNEILLGLSAMSLEWK